MNRTNSFFQQTLDDTDDRTLLRAAEFYGDSVERLPAQRSEIALVVILLSTEGRCSLEYLHQRSGYAPDTIARTMKALMRDDHPHNYRIEGNAREGYILLAD